MARSSVTGMLPEDHSEMSEKRFLRVGDKIHEDPRTEERVNVDLFLRDIDLSIKEAAKWKAQFITWKVLGKTSFTFTFKITSRLRPQHPHVLQSSPPHLVREGSHPQEGCSLT
ncbi:uncharacterized protein PITG_16533 [Phytophthora infestans T30-4]|uniref:Uncharacterized protein n=1 Tax=Phytophthora infestans (strain T30-4) TaxID=403677 RepID=D0NTV7_PHYIT|nr:uncharacterized protein PITG_16533 [Phytophthora infestans T30-4]EEY65069.1 hypothetical protein PITG_16533 [Phytophthora infestans T30-4]|eukprot:XP_002897557.1 hypothetical protein PITG_16533 [Phytophthora infestans T30-4]